MAISSYVGSEIVSSTDTFNVWLTRTNSIITDMGSVVVSIGDNNVGDVTITGALGANTLFAGTELRGGDADTSGDITITSNAIFDLDLTASGEILFDGPASNVTISTSNFLVNSTNTFFNDRVEFEDNMIIPVGTTAQRGESATGNFRFNTTTLKFEGYTGSEWGLRADTADTLTTSRNITLAGDVTGTVGFDGGSNVTLTTTLANSAGTTETIQDVVGAMVQGNSETGITVTYQDGDGTLDFAIDANTINHDLLQGFVADEHIDHSAVSINTGVGLTGGGNITATRTINLDLPNIDHDSLGGFVANEHVNHTSVSIVAGTGLTIPSGTATIDSDVTLQVDTGAINHDSLLGFVANEHINHSSVDITAGVGLTGGGNITSSRTLSVNAGNGLIANSTGVHIDSSANTTFSNLTVTNTLFTNALSANGSFGTINQVLTSDGTGTYWENISTLTGETDTLQSVTDRSSTTTNAITTGGLTLTANIPTFSLTGDVTGSTTFDGSNTSITTTINGADITVGTLTVDSISANGSVGTAGQVLTSDGTIAYWSSISGFDNQIKDLVGEMFSGNSESGINVVYQSADNTVDFDVDDFTITLGGDLSGSTTISNLGDATLTATVIGGAADTLATSRTITLAGEVTGNTTFDGSSDVTITTNLETVDGFTSTGNIVLSNADLDGFVTATYANQFEIVATSGAITINWNEGQNQIQTEPTGAITYTFTDPAGPGHFQLIIASDGTSTAQAITFPGSVKWMGTPYSGIDNKSAIINFYYDGTSTYYAIASYEN